MKTVVIVLVIVIVTVILVGAAWLFYDSVFRR